MSPEARLTICPGVYARAFGGELVLLEFAGGEYFGLDELGTEIWKLAEAGATLDEIAGSIVERFDVTRDVAFRDLVDLVAHMVEKGLVTIR